ncbi:MAG: sulfur carrier protein ThiS [Bacteroidales bacterium]|jgi:sulfur carrier protein|nr:sulfur carrier protein ThiS [Bacteroidales bacterium]
MVIFINDKQILTDETKSLEAILEGENLLQKEGMAVAVNGSIVPRKNWETATLNDGDKVDVISAFYGG